MNGHTGRYIFFRAENVSRATAAANGGVSALAEGLFEIRMRDTSAITFMQRGWYERSGASKLPSRLYRKLIVNLGSQRGGASDGCSTRTRAHATISVSRVPVNTITWRDSTGLSQILKLAPPIQAPLPPPPTTTLPPSTFSRMCRQRDQETQLAWLN